MTNLIIFSIFLVMVVSFIILFYKYKKLKNNTEKILEELEAPLKRGYYEKGLVIVDKINKNFNFTAIVYVLELERYSNGTSKIKIENIESGVSEDKMSYEKVKKYIESEFLSIKNTSDITWLEIEQSIKQIRKEKIKKIKSTLNV